MVPQRPGQVGRLVIVCGLPGSGKTTVAKRLESEFRAVRLCPDDWMEALGIDLFDAGVRARIEDLQWSLARRLLELQQIVVIEWGTWAREQRDDCGRAHPNWGLTLSFVYLMRRSRSCGSASSAVASRGASRAGR